MSDDVVDFLNHCEPYIKDLSNRFALPNSGLSSDDLEQNLRLLLLQINIENRTPEFFKNGEILGHTVEFLRRSANRIKMKEYRRWRRKL